MERITHLATAMVVSLAAGLVFGSGTASAGDRQGSVSTDKDLLYFHKQSPLRFTHAEEIEPLAALMALPGSTEPVAPDRTYTYRDNPWRGAEVAPMAANIQWDLPASTPAPGELGKPAAYLVRMLHNEKETAFKPSCEPVSAGSYFYALAELERCFGRG